MKGAPSSAVFRSLVVGDRRISPKFGRKTRASLRPLHETPAPTVGICARRASARGPVPVPGRRGALRGGCPADASDLFGPLTTNLTQVHGRLSCPKKKTPPRPRAEMGYFHCAPLTRNVCGAGVATDVSCSMYSARSMGPSSAQIRISTLAKQTGNEESFS